MRWKVFWVISGCLMVLILVLSACTASEITSTVSTTSSSADSTKAPISTTPGTTITGTVKPEGEVVAAIPSFGNENFLPWKSDNYCSQMNLLVYDFLIYINEVNRNFISGLAESWEMSPDALTLTYHLRKGIQFTDGWGEITSEDVKFTLDKQKKSPVGITNTRQIVSMDTPDKYTLVVHFKTTQPTFFMALSPGNGASMQGIVCKKYIETVGEQVAGQKPIGSGPYRLVESKLGTYYKFEGQDSHWRVVPEFKNLTIRMVPEVSTTVAMLKTKEIDLAAVPAEQLPGLKASGLATEVSSVGGCILGMVWGGCVIPEDSRYEADYHGKDPWMDVRVRKAMSLAIDRAAICNAVFAGGAMPTGATLFSSDMDKYQYPYDPAAARQLLKDAGYPNGFTFKAISYEIRGVPETPRLMEALAGYWQQIGLDPQITPIDYNAYSLRRNALKIAGEISLMQTTLRADMLDYIGMHFMPEGIVFQFQDEGSYAIWKEGFSKVNTDERNTYVNKLNEYFYENFIGSIVKKSYCYAWNSATISPFPHSGMDAPTYLEYVRHAQPLNTFRMFTPWEGR